MSAAKNFRPNRVLSNFLTPLLLRTPLTPNQITLLSLASGITAGFFFSQASYTQVLWAAFFYALACVLDNCDGEIARLKNMRSELGGWLDIVVDFFTDAALFIGIAFGIKAKGSALFSTKLFLSLCLIGGLFHFSLVIIEKLKGFGPAVFNAPNPDEEKRKNIVFKMFDGLREGEASWLVVGLAVANRADFILWFGAFYMQIIWISALFLNIKFILKKPRLAK